MKKFSFILMIFISALPLFSKAQSDNYRRPNVIVIISDDHRHDWMNHNGSEFMETPNLDQLAAEGWSFPNAFCVAGVCSPARASILTGKYMHQASSPDIVWQNNSFLQLQEMFPQRLHDEGYRTGYIGKFHLGEEKKPTTGFDLWASFPFVGDFFDQTIWVNGTPKKYNGFTDDNISELAGETIKEWAGSDQAFCLLVGLKAPHIPFVYPERMKSKYEENVFEEPETFNFDYSESKPGLSENLINAKTWPHAIPAYGSFQEWVRSYTRLATTIDESVGTIMKAVREAGITENTLIIYTSDHGYSLGEFSLCEKHYAYEHIMRIPLIVRFPDQVNPGDPPGDMVTQMDIAPTVMDYCTKEIPAEMLGKSWSVLLDPKNKKKAFREEFFFDFWHNARDILPPMQAVRTERYKLIDYEYMPYKELYDLEKDPLEKNNLINDLRYQDVILNMEKRLSDWKSETGWVERGKIALNKIYINENLTTKQPAVDEVLEKNNGWRLIEGENGVFNLEDYMNTKDCYIAVPMVNGSDYDPFINLRVRNPENKNIRIPYLGYFEGENIYSNVAWKSKHGIPTVSFQGAFDPGYNPPLRPGENVILIKLEMEKEMPAEWDFSVVGGIEKMEFL